jgi:Fic family protein
MDWGRFSFDYRYSWEKLFGQLVNIEAYKKSALNLVLPPDWKEKLDRLNRIRALYGTTALEGNPLSESEVSHQMDIVDQNGEGSTGKVTREQLQIRNSVIAQRWVKQRFTPGSPPIQTADILEMHRMVTQNSDTKNNVPGKLRTFSVVVGSPDMGGVHKGAPFEELPRLMEEYVSFINSERVLAEGPVIRALLAHFFLVTIHPFGDGNGRLSRLVEAGILFQHDYNVHGFYGLSNYFYRNEQGYKTLLQQCRACQPFNLDLFIGFGVEGFRAELEGINNFIKAKLNRVVYRAMLVRAFNTRIGARRKLINQREYNLLDFLLTETEPVDPFSENPSRRVQLSELMEAKPVSWQYRNLKPRTLYRELGRLRQLGFIHFQQDEHTKNWYVELDFNAIGRY